MLRDPPSYSFVARNQLFPVLIWLQSAQSQALVQIQIVSAFIICLQYARRSPLGTADGFTENGAWRENAALE